MGMKLTDRLTHEAFAAVRLIKWQVYYRGQKFYCPCCGKQSDKMRPFEVAGHGDTFDINKFPEEKKFVKCPVCCSLPRHRIIAFYLLRDNWITQWRGKKFIFFAPEESLVHFMKRSGVSYLSADLFDPGVDLHINIEEMPMENDSVDFVMCNHVLEHVDHVQKALMELYRVLRPGGALICTVPMDLEREKTYEDPSVTTPEGRIRAFGQSDHNRLFGLDFMDAIRAAGFELEVFKGEECPENILPIIAPAAYDANWVFIGRKRADTHMAI